MESYVLSGENHCFPVILIVLYETTPGMHHFCFPPELVVCYGVWTHMLEVPLLGELG